MFNLKVDEIIVVMLAAGLSYSCVWHWWASILACHIEVSDCAGPVYWPAILLSQYIGMSYWCVRLCLASILACRIEMVNNVAQEYSISFMNIVFVASSLTNHEKPYILGMCALWCYRCCPACNWCLLVGSQPLVSSPWLTLKRSWR